MGNNKRIPFYLKISSTVVVVVFVYELAYVYGCAWRVCLQFNRCLRWFSSSSSLLFFVLYPARSPWYQKRYCPEDVPLPETLPKSIKVHITGHETTSKQYSTQKTRVHTIYIYVYCVTLERNCSCCRNAQLELRVNDRLGIGKSYAKK